MKKTRFLLVITTILLFFNSAIFAAYLTIEPKTPFPSVVLQDKAALGEYLVTNQTSVRLSISDTSTFNQATQILSGGNYCGAQTILQPRGSAGDSCVIGRTITPGSQMNVTGQISAHIDGTYITVVYPQDINFQAVAQLPTDTPVLSVLNPDIKLAVGVLENIVVTNTSSTVAANNVQFYMQPDLADKIAAETGCSNINPGQSCTMSLTAKASATPSSGHDMIIQGSNTFPLSTTVEILPEGEVFAGNVYFTGPSTQKLLLTNVANATADIDNISFVGSNIHNVTIGDFHTECPTIAANGGTCEVSVTATNQSYGSDQIQVDYHLASLAKSATSSVEVSPTQLQFLDQNGDPFTDAKIHVSIPDPSPLPTYRVKNVGNFVWKNKQLDWFGTALPGVSIINNNCTSGDENPGDYCTFQLSTSSAAKPGSTQIIRASGTNADNEEHNVVVTGGLGIMPDLTPANIHLAYKAIEVENLTDHSAVFDNIDISHTLNSGKVEYCIPGGTNCDVDTSVGPSECTVGGTLPASSSCLIWLKANRLDDADLGSVSGTITVNLTPIWPAHGKTKNKNNQEIISKTFPANYKQSLYVGKWDTPPYLQIWDGTSWSSLATQPDNNVDTLTMWRGDLYVGGAFNNPYAKIVGWNGAEWFLLPGLTIPGSDAVVINLGTFNNYLYIGGTFIASGSEGTYYYIAAWDGANWLQLKQGASGYPGLNNRVDALLMKNNILYIGGIFNHSGSISLNKIASWDGSAWTDLGTGGFALNRVYFISALDNDLFVGGEFNIQQLDIPSFTWSGPLGGVGTNGIVDAITTLDGNVYAGGFFTTAGGVSRPYIAGWNPVTQNWFSLGGGANGFVHAIESLNHKLYVGGEFNQVYNLSSLTVNKIAQWDGTNWSKLGPSGSPGPGVNSSIFALLVVPALNITSP